MSRTFITPEIEDALKIARNTRENILNGSVSVENNLLGFYTVAEILGEKDDLNWAYFELNEYPGSENLPEYRTNLFGFFVNSSGTRLAFEHTETHRHTFHDGVPKIEYLLKSKDKKIRYAVSDTNIEKLKSLGCPDANHSCGTIHPKVEIGKILGAVKLELIKRLNKMINEFTYGQVPENIFEYIRNEVDSDLAKLCPKAVEKLPIMYAQLSSNDKVVYSEIASTCRRIIKDVADVLYPPSETPVVDVQGKEHAVDDNAYVNRILARIQQSIQSGSEKKVFSSMFGYVDGLLKSINEYASKGDHSEFTKTDAIRCIVYTYLLLGDILHYYVKPDKNAK